jgi:hypothetical protein
MVARKGLNVTFTCALIVLLRLFLTLFIKITNKYTRQYVVRYYRYILTMNLGNMRKQNAKNCADNTNRLKADSHIACRTHAAPMRFP